MVLAFAGVLALLMSVGVGCFVLAVAAVTPIADRIWTTYKLPGYRYSALGRALHYVEAGKMRAPGDYSGSWCAMRHRSMRDL